MAASKGSGITAVHFALMFFVMLSIVLGVTTYLFYDDYRTATLAEQAAQTEKNAQYEAARKLTEEVTALKNAVGVTFEEVGVNNPTPTTVLGEINRQLQQNGTQLQPGTPNTLVAQLGALRQQLDTATAERNQMAATIRDKDNQILALSQQYQDQVDQHKKYAEERETDLRGVQSQTQEQIASEQQKATELQTQLQTVMQERDALDQRLQELVASSQKTQGELEGRLKDLSDMLGDLQNLSFDRPLGEIVKVAPDSRAVWINLGSADDLRPRTTFSVYRENNQGVGTTGGEDIKGAIQVTRIMGPHLAEAKVLDDQLAHPISSGDPIFTPLWKPNSPLHFATVGLIDFDGIDAGGDRRSDDRAALHDLVRSAGGRIVAEVDDLGNRTGPLIDEQVKFLVIGSLPDQATAATDEERAQATALRDQRLAMIKEAEQQGVRVVTLDDFLTWMGYVNRQRLWRPGQEAGYTVESGGRGTAVDEAIEMSGRYGNRRRMPLQDTNRYRGGATVDE